MVPEVVVNAAVTILVPRGFASLKQTDLIIGCEYVIPPILTDRCDLKVPLRRIQCVVKEVRRKNVCIELRLPPDTLKNFASRELALYIHEYLLKVLAGLERNFFVRFAELTEELMIEVETLPCTLTSDVNEGIRAAQSWQRLARSSGVLRR